MIYPTVMTIHDSWVAFVDSAMIIPRLGLANSYWKVPSGYLHRRINKYFFTDVTLVSPSKWLTKFFHSAGFSLPVHIPNGLQKQDTCTAYEDELLWVGSLTKFKGLPTVMGALTNAADQLGWRLTIVGDGPCKKTITKRIPKS